MRFPEWFVGGVLHGKDRLLVYPVLRESCIRVSASKENKTYVYHRCRISVCDVPLLIWVPDGQPHAYTVRKLGEIIMIPHTIDTQEEVNT